MHNCHRRSHSKSCLYSNNCFSGRFEYCEIPKCTDEEIEQMDLCTDVDCGVGGDCYLNK